MLTIILLLALMITLYHRVSLKITSVILAAILVAWSVYDSIPYVHWIIFLAIFVPLNVTLIRRKISAKLLDVFKGIMPRISDTEQEALDAGTVWWEAEVFGGKPNWKRLHGFEKATKLLQLPFQF